MNDTTPPPHQDPAAESPHPAPPPPRHEPARLPGGFWGATDYALRNPDNLMESIRRDEALWQVSKRMLLVSVAMAALYGAIMGATGLLAGLDVPWADRLLQIVATTLKVPALFFLTLLVVLPPVYVSNAFIGARNSFSQMVAMLTTTAALTTTLLASMASVAFFFALTSESYNFLKLLHVVFFAYAGLVGIAFLSRCVNYTAEEKLGAARGLLFAWVLLYGFVGLQLAWVLRPFIGHPAAGFEWFREREGNIYESIFYSLQQVLGGG
jgi:hypothetical protein